MRFAYYPGCSAKGSTAEADVATKWVAKKLGIELDELTDAGCCGSCEIKAVNPTLHFMLNARILSMAAERKLEILTICDTCQANLLETSRKLESGAADIREKLANAGVSYGETPRVRHFAAIVAQEIGVDSLRQRVTRALAGLKVAPFACCHSFRGPGASPGARGTLDELVVMTGATVVPARLDSDCCGFHIVLVNEELAARTAGRFLTRCADMQVDCVVTTSPLCHTALDIYQRKAERVTGRSLRMPVLHVEQLLALAFGATRTQAGLDRNIVSTHTLTEHV